MEELRPPKPLGRKAYGHIGHLPGSRLGPGDHMVPAGQGRICTEKRRDARDEIIVQEKVDGSCVAVAKLDGNLIPLGRAGYPAITSPYPQHMMFADWAYSNYARFDAMLREGERCVGEWLAQAHGTRYTLTHEPFCPFDIMVSEKRMAFDPFLARLDGLGFTPPHLLNRGPSLSVEIAMRLLGPHGYHGAIDRAEGVVYRVQRDGKVDFLAKYVRPDKIGGCYLPEITGDAPVWNWSPVHAKEPT